VSIREAYRLINGTIPAKQPTGATEALTSGFFRRNPATLEDT
jgi:hypothetical protein